ncbi:UNVERIFIED_CONTAM: hypothetical protein PYX00_009763 [Menopon gallinae]|uniref:Uncharacterized protein n=1 Tax=Menopon gallinae TaxID=328185 RepID=A0AAW2HCK4_9NEOP
MSFLSPSPVQPATDKWTLNGRLTVCPVIATQRKQDFPEAIINGCSIRNGNDAFDVRLIGGLRDITAEKPILITPGSLQSIAEDHTKWKSFIASVIPRPCWRSGSGKEKQNSGEDVELLTSDLTRRRQHQHAIKPPTGNRQLRHKAFEPEKWEKVLRMIIIKRDCYQGH